MTLKEEKLLDDLRKCCIVALDWLADKGVPRDHPVLSSMIDTIEKAEQYLEK